LPAVIGHRGAAARAPENTLAGLRRAKALGCEWVEFDTRLTLDGVPVLCHDPRLERTTDGFGPISSLRLAAVREWDAGIGFDASFAGERVPTLEQALLLCAELGLGANIEMKADPKGRHFAIGRAVRATLDALAGRVGPVLASSFLPATLLELCSGGGPPRGILFRVVPRDWNEFAERFGCCLIGADHRRLRRRRVADMRDAGYQVAAYTVNDPGRARVLYDWGVTSVFSDIPDIILRSAAAHGATRAVGGALHGHVLTRQGAIR
jgi:glycerophosphoryl diester phosphodiesterase